MCAPHRHAMCDEEHSWRFYCLVVIAIVAVCISTPARLPIRRLHCLRQVDASTMTGVRLIVDERDSNIDVTLCRCMICRRMCRYL